MAGEQKRGRRLRRLIAWLIGLHAGGLLLVLLLAAPFILIRVHAVRTWILDQSLHRGVFDDRTHLRIDRILRFDPAGLSLRGVRLMSGRGADERPWASLGRIDIRWDPLLLLRGSLRAQSISMDSLIVDVDVPPPGLRRHGGGESTRGRADLKLPALALDRFALDAIELRDGPKVLLRASVTLRELQHDRRKISARVEQGRLELQGDSLEVSFLEGEIRGELLTVLSLTGLAVRSEGVEAVIDVEARFPEDAERGPAYTSSVTVDRFVPGKVPYLNGRDLPLEQGDSVAGSITASLERGRLGFGAGLHGLLRGAPMDTLVLEGERSGDTLAVRHFVLAHRAGTLEGEGRYQIGRRVVEGRVAFHDLDPGDAAIVGPTARLPHGVLEGEAEGSASLSEGVRVDVVCRLASGTLQGSALGPLLAEARLENGIIHLDTLRYEDGSLTARGRYDPSTRRVVASAHLRRFESGPVLGPLLKIPFDGSVDGAVDLAGAAEALHADGWLSADDLQVVEVTAARVRADSLVATFSPFALRGSMRAESIDAYKIPMDSARAHVDWTNKLRVRAEVFLDSVQVDAGVAITPAEPGSLSVEDFVVRPGNLAPWSAMPGAAIRWERGSAQIRDVDVRSDPASVRGWLDVARGGTRMDGAFAIETLDLSRVREFFALPESTLAGMLDARGGIAGTAADPGGVVRLDGKHIVVGQWPVGELRAAIRAERDGLVRVDSVDAGKGDGWGRVHVRDLRLDLPRPLVDFLSEAADSLPRFLDDTRIDGRLSVDDLRLARIVQSGLAASPADASAWLAVSTDPMARRIRTVNRDEEGVASTQATDLDGTIRFEAVVGGSPQAPSVGVEGQVADLRVYQARADSVLFAVTYVPGTLSIDSLLWHRQSDVARAAGSIPLVVRMEPPDAHLQEGRPLAVDAQLPDIDLSLLGILSPQIQDPAGLLSGRISLRGTPGHIWPEGNLRIRQGGIRVPMREERLRDIEAEIVLDSTGAHLPFFTARVGRDGTLEAQGAYRNPRDYEFSATAKDVTFYETGLYYAKADADLSMFPVVTETATYPLIVGTAKVQEGAILGDLAKQQPPPDTGGKPSPIRAEIDVSAPGNLRISTPVAEVLLGEGEDLHVSFEDPLINISGRLTVLSGRYRVFNNVFEISSGTVEFRDRGLGPEPVLDIQAQTQVPDPTDANQPETITVHAEGPVTNLTFEFSSSKNRSEPEIVELLSLGRFTDPSGQSGVTSTSSQYVFTELVSQLETQMSRVFQPLRNLEVQTGFGPSEPWRINYRHTVMPQLALAYSVELSGETSEEIKLHYNLKGIFYLTAGLEREGEAGRALVDRYSLDLKMRFEYK